MAQKVPAHFLKFLDMESRAQLLQQIDEDPELNLRALAQKEAATFWAGVQLRDRGLACHLQSHKFHP